MREMKDSGVEWIGEIPKEWRVQRVKILLKERNEKNSHVKTKLILSLGAKYGIIPYSEKDGGGNKSKEDVSAYKLAYKNDLVMNSMNIISGAVGMSDYFGCVSPVYYVYYPRKQTTNINYYHMVFQSQAFQRSLLGLGNGILIKETDSGSYNTVRMRIPIGKMNDVLLPVPSCIEQNEISKYLDSKCSKIDAIIEREQAVIEKLKEYKLSVITEAVTKGLNPDVEMKDSGYEFIGDIPTTWAIKQLRYIGKCQNGISKSGEFFGSGLPFVSYSDVYKNYELPQNASSLIESTEAEQENYSVKRGDIFFTRTSETIEEVGLTSVCLTDIDKATFAGFLIRVRPFENVIDPLFAKYYFRSEHHRRFIVKEMNLVTRASLGQELLKRLPVLLPPKAEQLLIADYLERKCNGIENSIFQKQTIIDKLTEYKKSLIYEVVTGKLEV